VAILPLGELRFVERVGKRVHGDEVPVLAKRARRRGADAVGGAVGSAELRMRRFQVLELAKQAVVLGVRHFGPVEHVVGVVRPLEEPPQLGGARRRALHRPFASSLMTAMATATSRSSSSALARGSRPSAPPPYPALDAPRA